MKDTCEGDPTIALDQVKKLLNQIVTSEKAIAENFPGVAWDFTSLRNHISSLGEMLGQGQVQAAHFAHQSFSIAAPGKLLASKRAPKPTCLIRSWARMGGKVKSERKTAALRQNLVKARLAKAQYAAAGLARPRPNQNPEFERAARRIRELRSRLRRLRQNELRAKKDIWVSWRSYVRRREMAAFILSKFEQRYPALARPKWKKPYAHIYFGHWLERKSWEKTWLFKMRALMKHTLRKDSTEDVRRLLERVDGVLYNSALKNQEKKDFLTEIFTEIKEGTWETSFCCPNKAAVSILRALRRETQLADTAPTLEKTATRMVARHVHSLVIKSTRQDPAVWNDSERQEKLVNRISSLLYDYAHGVPGDEEKTARRLFEVARATFERLEGPTMQAETNNGTSDTAPQ